MKRDLQQIATNLQQEGAGKDTLLDILGFTSVEAYTKAASRDKYWGSIGEIELFQRGSPVTVESVTAPLKKSIRADFVYCGTTKALTAFVLFSVNNNWKNGHYDLLYVVLPGGKKKFLFNVGAETDAARRLFERLCKSKAKWTDPTKHYTWSSIPAGPRTAAFMTCPLDSLFMVYKSMTVFLPSAVLVAENKLTDSIEELLSAAGCAADETIAKCKVVEQLREAGAWDGQFADVCRIDEAMGQGNVTREIMLDMK